MFMNMVIWCGRLMPQYSNEYETWKKTGVKWSMIFSPFLRLICWVFLSIVGRGGFCVFKMQPPARPSAHWKWESLVALAELVAEVKHRAGGSCSKINFPFMGEQVVAVSFDTLPSCGDQLLVWDWHQVHTYQGNKMSSLLCHVNIMIITYNNQIFEHWRHLLQCIIHFKFF